MCMCVDLWMYIIYNLKSMINYFFLLEYMLLMKIALPLCFCIS